MFFGNNNKDIVEPFGWGKSAKKVAAAAKKAAAEALQNDNKLITAAIESKLGENKIDCTKICDKLPGENLINKCKDSCEAVKTKVSGCVKDSISEISK